MFDNNKTTFGKYKPLKVLFFIAVFAALAAVASLVVMLLWNAILPDVTGVKPLTFWKAAGLLLLSKILFGGFGRKRKHWKKSKRKHWKNKWMNMNPNERSEAKSRWDAYCKGKNAKEE